MLAGDRASFILADICRSIAARNQGGQPPVTLVDDVSTKKTIMPPKTSDDDRPTEDDLARQKLGPRGVPGESDSAKMTPQQKKNMPEVGKFDGHTA